MAQGSQDAKFVILHIKSGGSFVKLAGQTNTTFGGTTTIADTTNKDSIWVLGLTTKITGNVTCDVNVMESTELGLIETAWNTGGVIEAKIFYNENLDFYHTAEWAVANLTYNGPDTEATSVSIELQPKTALATST